MTELVCPNCGNNSFLQLRTTRTAYTVEINDWGFEEVESVTVDAGDISETDVKCTECGKYFPSDSLEFVTPREYDRLRALEMEPDPERGFE